MEVLVTLFSPSDLNASISGDIGKMVAPNILLRWKDRSSSRELAAWEMSELNVGLAAQEQLLRVCIYHRTVITTHREAN